MKKQLAICILGISTLMIGSSAFAAPSQGGGGPIQPPTASAGCGGAVNGNGTFPYPGNRQREWPWANTCTLNGGNSSNYTYVSAFSITYNASWASTPSYNVTTTYNWTCSVAGVGGGSSANCGVGRVNWCGSANGQSLTSTPTSNLCAYGTPSAVATSSSTFTWSCSSSFNYGSSVGTKYRTDYCSATRLAGSCGSANGLMFLSAPTAGLCNAGTASAVNSSLTTGYTWTCSYGGAGIASCSAIKAIQKDPCTDTGYAAAQYAACQANGTCSCYNVFSTGATSSITAASATYTGTISFQSDNAGFIMLGVPLGAGSAGALNIPYNGPALSVGVGVAGVNTAKPGVAFDVKGLMHLGTLTGGTFTRALTLSNTGLVGASPLSGYAYWLWSGSNAYYSGGKVGIATNNPTEKLQVMGNVKANAFLTSSDKRLKHGILSLNGGLASMLSLEPVSFTWKYNNKKDIGFIAQNVEDELPTLVETDEQGYKSVKYSNLLAPVVTALQQMNIMLSDLSEKKLAEQEKQITELETRMQRLQNLVNNIPSN